MPPKNQTFYLASDYEMLSGQINIRHPDINCDPLCVRSGVIEWTVNHFLFECPTELQT